MSEVAEGILDKLTFLFAADTSDVDKGMEHVEDTFKRGFDNILRNFVTPLTGALAAGRLFSGFTQQADKIAKFSRSLNINSEELQVWGEAAALAGGSAQAFQNSVRMLQRRISMSGDSSGRGGDMFKKLGISIKDASGKTKDAFQIMSELAAKADKMDKVEFAGLAQRLRIDQGTIQLLQQGSEGVKKLVDEMREFGTISDEDAAAAEDYNDAMEKFRRSTSVAAAKVFSALLPPISAMITQFAKFVAFLTKNKALIRGAGFAAMAVAISSKLLPMLKRLSTALNLKSSFGSWAKLAAVFTALYLVVEDFVVWLRGGKSALAGFWSAFGTQDEIRKKFEKLRDSVKNVLDFFGKHSGLVKKFFALFSGVSTVFVAISAFRKLSKMISDVGAGFKAAAKLVRTNPYVLIAAAISLALLAIVENWDAIKDAMLNCWNAIKNTWGTFSDWFTNIWQRAIDGLSSIIPDWLKSLLKGIKVGTVDTDAKMPTNTNPLFAPAMSSKAAIEGLAPMAGSNNNTVNNDTEIRIQELHVEANDAEEFVDSMQKVKNSKSKGKDTFTDSALNNQAGQYIH